MRTLTFLLVGSIAFISQSVNAKRIVTLSPASARGVIDVGHAKDIVCSAEPFGDLPFNKNVKSVGFYHRPVIEKIIACKPDLIIATYSGTPPDVYNKLKELKYNLVLENNHTVKDIKISILNVAKILNTTPPKKLINDFEKACNTKNKSNKEAVMIIGLEPLIAVGNNSFISSAMNCARYKNLIDGDYPRITIERLINLNPQTIIVSVTNPEKFKEYIILKTAFKNKIKLIDPETIQEPSSRILKGIEKLKNL